MTYLLIGLALLLFLVFVGWRIRADEKKRHRPPKRPDLNPSDFELRVLNRRSPMPRSRGLTPDQQDAEAARFAYELRLKGCLSFDLTRRRAVEVGSKGYRWRSAGDEDVCSICARHDGKFFGWDAPPPCGPPGTHSLCPQGYCRCYPEVILPD